MTPQPEEPERGPGPRGGGIAFLLSQLGADASSQFAARLTELGISPAQAGLLRAIVTAPGRSQRALAAQLGVVPSTLVALVDELERRGLVERRLDPGDRRRHALHLTGPGQELFGRLSTIARAHEQDWTAGLSPDERDQLFGLLRALAASRDLTPGVHPGYRDLAGPAQAGSAQGEHADRR